MKIKMTESFVIEADSIAEVEMAYAEGYIDDYALKGEFVSIEFTEKKENEEMENRTITLTLKEFAELMRMADSFQLLKTAAKADKYLTDLEKAVFGMHEEPTEEPTEDNF